MRLPPGLKRALYMAVRSITGRIRSGPLEGKRWTLFAGSRFIRGTFEPEKTEALMKLFKPGEVFYDIGANAGYFSVLASEKLGEEGRIFAFEPSPVTFAYLEVNLRINNCKNVTAFPLALGDCEGQVCMDISSGRGTHKVSSSGSHQARALALDKFIAQGNPVPDLVKIDVEGYELSVLAGAMHTLETHHPNLVVAVHSPVLEAGVRKVITELGYSIETIVVSKGDTELFATYSG